jgi:multidrug efflux pump subunit AcrA (membrane-fusion protein)
LNEREAELDERELQLDERQADLDGRQSQLDQRQAELDQRQAAAEASQFGDGLFAVGADIQPGRYHTEGGGTCYWAKLRSSDTFDIEDNNVGGGPQTIDINTAFFESQDCGTWTKVG